MSRPVLSLFLSLVLVLQGVAPLEAATRAKAGDDNAFRDSVLPFLNRNCVGCHNRQMKTGGLELDAFPESGTDVRESPLWKQVREKLVRGEMPPPGQTRPEPKAVEAVLAWIRSLGGDSAGAPVDRRPDPGRVTARRLNRAEYDNTIRDLLGVDLKPAADFPADDSGYGFDNIGDVLSLPPILMEKYMAAAERIAEAAIVARPPVEATLVKYLAPREAEHKGFFPAGDYRIDHEFPAAGEYELRVRVVDRRYRPKKDEPPPPMPANGIMAVSFGGNRMKTFEVEPNVYERGTFDVTLDAGARKLELYAHFLSDGMENIPEPVDRDNSYKGERKLFVDNFLLLGPLKARPLPVTESHRRLMTCGDPDGGYQPDCARRILERLLRRAYRRPVREGEVESVLRLVEMACKEGDSFAEAMRVAVRAVLVSPHFLFRIERDPDPTDPDLAHEIDSHELAARLSYFLWSSMPDDELFRLADSSKLADPAVLEAQVRRMLADPKARALAENFAGQWLELRNLDEVRPDPDLFPDFDAPLRAAMRRETELFFETVLSENLSILDFLDARFSFLNQRLARHYGLDGIEGDHFRRVELDGLQRAGVLTQASILTLSSYPTRTSPVLRGKWLLENILGTPPPDPPPGIPELEAEKVGFEATLREQLEQHRSNPGCASCHIKMDALGFGLENYDPVGAWRTRQGKFPIDSAGTLPGGRSFTNPSELRAILLEDRNDFARCLTEKMLTYALGRGLEEYDRPAVDKILLGLEQDYYRLSRLVLEIAHSMPFRMRRGEEER